MQADITWNKRAELPKKMSHGTTLVIDGKVYCGGGEANKDSDKHTVYCYYPSQDKWTTLPQLPVRGFGLGQVHGELVAVGGLNLYQGTNVVYTYDERSRRWKETIPPIPTARSFPGVLSLQSALIVAGGATLSFPASFTAVVEIFKPDSSQWYRTDPLPTACQTLSLIAYNNTCYALGGYNSGKSLDQALYASTDDLLSRVVPVNQTSYCSASSYTLSAWKALPNTQTYRPTAATLGGRLLAIGGLKTYSGGGVMKGVYMYSPSTDSWSHVSDLPAPQSGVAVAVMSSREILVIGGFGTSYNRVKTVCKATLRYVS